MNTKELNSKAISIAIKKIKATYSPDKIIMQVDQAINEEEHSINVQYERLREVYGRYNPEAIEKVKDVKELIKMITSDAKRPADTMGYDFSKEEISLMKDYANEVNNHLTTITLLESFIDKQVKELLPETSKLAGPLLTGKLIRLANGLKNLAMMPASTIQLLGAEKALFRHLKSKAKPPKHGVILYHQSVQAAKNKGKAARQLANQLMKTIRKDYFGGKPL